LKLHGGEGIKDRRQRVVYSRRKNGKSEVRKKGEESEENDASLVKRSAGR